MAQGPRIAPKSRMDEGTRRVLGPAEKRAASAAKELARAQRTGGGDIRGGVRGAAARAASASARLANLVKMLGRGAIGPPDVRKGTERTLTRKSTGGRVRGGQESVNVPPKNFQRLKGSR